MPKNICSKSGGNKEEKHWYKWSISEPNAIYNLKKSDFVLKAENLLFL
jgi:hypothetical protein